jgi:hypothetical protein
MTAHATMGKGAPAEPAHEDAERPESATRSRAAGVTGGDVGPGSAILASVPSSRGTSTVTQLEKAVISRILDDPQLTAIRSDVDFDAVVVVERRSTGVGTLTNLGRSPELKLFDDAVTLIWWKVGARLNDEGLETGCVIYVCEGYVTVVQSYTYGEKWPDEVRHFQVHDL